MKWRKSPQQVWGLIRGWRRMSVSGQVSVWGRVSDPSKPGAARQRLLRWLKFNVVGASGIAVQLSVLSILRSILHVNYLAATALAVEAAVLSNFYWHERFTWSDRRASGFTRSLARLARFNLSNGLVSILGNLAVMTLLVGIAHMNYFAANLIAITACSLVNFALSDCFVFQAETEDRRVTTGNLPKGPMAAPKLHFGGYAADKSKL